MWRPGLVLLVLLLLPPPLPAQSLGDAAARARQRREEAVAASARVLTNDDLQKYVEPEPGQLEDATTPVIEPPSAPASPMRQATHRRHVASAETYMKQCESRLTAARERWLAAGESKEPRALEEARRALLAARQAFERSRLYRDQAEAAARRVDEGQ
jgi:hypothetical protein